MYFELMGGEGWTDALLLSRLFMGRGLRIWNRRCCSLN